MDLVFLNFCFGCVYLELDFIFWKKIVFLLENRKFYFLFDMRYLKFEINFLYFMNMWKLGSYVFNVNFF